MSELTIEETHCNDKEDILNLVADFNEGLDNLYEYFDFFQKCQNVSSYVCRTGNQKPEGMRGNQKVLQRRHKAVGYVACHRVDDGETILTRAARVRPDCQGRGVYKHMLMEIGAVKKEQGSTRRYAVVKTRPPASSNLQKYLPVAGKEAHVFQFTKRQLEETSMCDVKEFVNSLTKIEGIPVTYLCEPYSSYLFPERRIIVETVPLRLIESNLKLDSTGNTVFVSDIHLNECKKLEYAATHVKGLVTASSIYHTRDFAEMILILDVFGSDINSFNTHVTFHLKRLQEQKPEHVNFKIYASKVCDSSVIYYTLGEFGIKRLEKGPRLDDCIKLEVYEKELT